MANILKTCPQCKEPRDIESFLKANDKRTGIKVYSICSKCRALNARTSIKKEFIEAYGGSCQCCGEPNQKFLTLDHVKNDGGVDRKTLQCHQIYYLAKKLGFPKDIYQLLCFNCNMGKGIYGVCPHKL